MAPSEGLAPRTEQVERLEAVAYGPAPRDIAQRNRLADHLFEDLATAYARGEVDPVSVDKNWRLVRPAFDRSKTAQALEAGAMPSTLLATLLPNAPEYSALRNELATLNAQPQSKARDEKLVQVRANLERWRWMPRALPSDRVEVRIPAYHLDLYRDGAPTVGHDVIVGARHRPSPTFAAAIQSVTLNPAWDPPPSIESELIARFRRNPAAAVREGFEAILPDGSAVDASEINWRAKPFPYDLRQRPGQDNALGAIRFNMPNPYAVYLHDTSSKTLFDREKRALSHGCVRVRDPMVLALALLDEAEWNEETLAVATTAGETRVIDLPKPMPVYILYLTTAVGADRTIVYFEDVYHLDDAIVTALDKPKPAN